MPNPARTARVTHELNTAIYHAFQDANVEIPFPQREVHVSMAQQADRSATGVTESNSVND